MKKHQSYTLTTPSGVTARITCSPDIDQKQIDALCKLIDAAYQDRPNPNPPKP